MIIFRLKFHQLFMIDCFQGLSTNEILSCLHRAVYLNLCKDSNDHPATLPLPFLLINCYLFALHSQLHSRIFLYLFQQSTGSSYKFPGAIIRMAWLQRYFPSTTHLFGSLLSNHCWSTPTVRVFRRLLSITSFFYLVFNNPRIWPPIDSWVLSFAGSVV